MLMVNFAFLCLHIAVISALTLIALRAGIGAMAAWLALLACAMNLFVLKQVTILGINATSSDALAVGYLLGLNLIQEFFGQKAGRRCLWIAFSAALAFVLLSYMQLLYRPNPFDWSTPHYSALLSPLPRLTFASLISFLIMQLVDVRIFSYLKKKSLGRFFFARQTAALLLSQLLDTVLFSCLGLFGLVHSILSIILFSFLIKSLAIFLSAPALFLAKKYFFKKEDHVEI